MYRQKNMLTYNKIKKCTDNKTCTDNRIKKCTDNKTNCIFFSLLPKGARARSLFQWSVPARPPLSAMISACLFVFLTKLLGKKAPAATHRLGEKL